MQKFFASSNSGRGFASYFGDIFTDLQSHYIIKGGPGTGKSSFIKAAAKAAEDKGLQVEYFYCSSDPDSLDGILVKELSLGITDGTAPHTSDPVCPGAIGHILDLGAYWNKEVLKESRDIIAKSEEDKNCCYTDAYGYLGAALSLELTDSYRIERSVDTTELFKYAESYIQNCKEEYGRPRIRLTRGITSKGACRFYPYSSSANEVYNIKDSYGIAYLFLEHICRLTSGRSVVISYDPLDTAKPDMLYMPTEGKLFFVNSDVGTEIDLDNFVSNGIDKNNTNDIRNILISKAYGKLAQAGKHHMDLENIYIHAMDFSRKEEYQNKIIKDIFS